MTNFIAHTGHDLDMGALTFVASVGDLLNTFVTLRIGRLPSTCAALRSTAPPEGTIMVWNPGTGTLVLDLGRDIINEIGVGIWTYEITITRSTSGRRLWGTRGTLQIEASLPEEAA